MGTGSFAVLNIGISRQGVGSGIADPRDMANIRVESG